MPLFSTPTFFREAITPWQGNKEKQRQVWSWVACLFPQEATYGNDLSESWELLEGGGGGIFQSQMKPFGVKFHYRRWHPTSLSSCGLTIFSCRLASMSADLLCQAKRQWGRCSCKDSNEPKQSSRPQLSAQTAPVSARSHPDLFFASNSHSQFIPSLAPLGREPQNLRHGMGGLGGSEKSSVQLPLFPEA